MYSERQQVCISEKDTLEYQWEQVSGPAVYIKDADQIQASFIPQEMGNYLFRFRAFYPITEVNKKELLSDWCYTAVTVGGALACGPPTADAGQDQELSTSLGSPQTVYLDGTTSHAVLQEACDLGLFRYTWTVTSEPAGSFVPIADSDQAEASAELSVVGEYEFQLEVQDNGGTIGRTDTASDVVKVTLREREGCGADLEVTAINAITGEALADVVITVEDALGDSYTTVTNAQGVAVFDSLADGERQSVSAVCDELVPPVGAVGGDDRPRFETTTVMNHCASQLTIPMRYTASGERAGDWGTVVAKVPIAVFDMLPHSWMCAGECNDDNDCDESQYCELDEDTPCGPKPPEIPRGTCTPRSVLPFFSLGDPYISGQVRFVMVLPVLPLGSLDHSPLESLFSRPVAEDALWAGNFATEDRFLNGLASALGLDPWGDPCTTTSDCPDDNVCEQDPWGGDYRCKDKSTLRNIRIEVPAGQARRLIAVAGILDFSMLDVLPVLLPFLTSDSSGSDVGFLKTFLANARMHSLLVCPFTVDVAAAGETDIAPQLSALSGDDCWRVEYQSKDTVVPFIYSPDSDPPRCQTDADCCSSGSCGWPNSGKKCLPGPGEIVIKRCHIPFFRVEIISSDYMALLPSLSGFDLSRPKSDGRLCSWVPDTAPFEVMCPTGTPHFYESCWPLDIRDLDVPADFECSFPYGLVMVSLDFPPGHPVMPEGGRAIVGFGLNRTPTSFDVDPEFLVPNLGRNGLDGAAVTATQLLYRNAYIALDGNYALLPGLLGATGTAHSNVSMLQLENFLPFLAMGGIDDVGMNVKVTFIADDPSVFPPTLIKTYAEALTLRQPAYGTHELPFTIELSPDQSHDLIGLVIERVNQVERERHPVVDPLWRIYIPADATSVTLPASVSPFKEIEELRVTPWASSFPVPFDYDLFPTDLILRHRAAYSQDSYGGTYPRSISYP